MKTDSKTLPNSSSQLPKKELMDILDLCRKLNAETQFPEFLKMLAQEAAKILQAESTSILIYDRERCELVSFVTLDGVPVRFDARLGIAGSALMKGMPLIVANAAQDSRFYPGIDRLSHIRTRSVLAIPLQSNSGEIIGVFEAINKKGGSFSRHDLELGTLLVDQTASVVETAQILHLVTQQRDQLSQVNAQLWKEMEGRFSTQNLIGTSPRVQNIIRLIDQVRDSSVDVLITGENGTGKELVAKAIHYNSLRVKFPFVALNCAALPENLLESELFGIEKGIATGVEARIGKFEQANGGTLFLDEIGDLGKRAQAKILRVLQERAFERVGGQTNISIDVRVIAATNKKLEDGIAQGDFREDLYYRLKIIHIHTPALREIPDDIPMLANFFLHKYCQEMRTDPKRFSPSALKRMESYFWPGNVRQLENEIKRLVVTVRRTVITGDDLDESIRFGKVLQHSGTLTPCQTIHEAVEDLEKRMIQEALQSCHYNQVQSAKLLGLSRQGLIKKVKRYGIGEP